MKGWPSAIGTGGVNRLAVWRSQSEAIENQEEDGAGATMATEPTCSPIELASFESAVAPDLIRCAHGAVKTDSGGAMPAILFRASSTQESQ